MTRKPHIVHYRGGSYHQCPEKCVCQNGAWLVPCTDALCNVPIGYLLGKFEPNFSVPALVQQENQP